MHLKRLRIGALAVPTVALAAGMAMPTAAPAAVTLDFSGNICGATGDLACGNGSQIGQDYGDIAGMVDVGYRSFTTSTGVTFEAFLKHWAGSYGDLSNVVWGGSSASAHTSEITFAASAGYEVSLIGFDAGCYQNRSSCQTLNFDVMDGNGTTLLAGSTPTDFPGHAYTAVNSLYASTIVLQWGPDGYDLGLDNIMFDVRQASAVVPEPATWAMMIGGFGMVGGAMRRRQSGAALA